MAFNLGSVALRTYNRLESVPDAVSGNITNYAEEAKLYVQNYVQETISNDPIPDKYVTLLIDLTCAYTLGRMAQVGVDFDYSIGEFSVSKGNSSNYDKRVDFYLQQANLGLKLVKPNQFNQTFF